MSPQNGHFLAPPTGLRAPELPAVNTRGQPQESGGDSKAYDCDGRMDERTDGNWTDRYDCKNSDLD